MNETNWAGNVIFASRRLHEPSTVDEVREIVIAAAAAGRRVGVVGSRHSFSTVADTDGDLVSTVRLNRVVAIDHEAMTATVQAGIRYGDLASELQAAGLALSNLPSLPHITVGGAVATGTHGSGVGLQNLSTAVTAFEMVDASGAEVRWSRDDVGGRFDGGVVGLGALGVVTSLMLTVAPTFDVSQVVYRDLPISVGLDHLDDVLAAGYSVSLFTDWQSDVFHQVWCKFRSDGSAQMPDHLFGALPADTPLHMVPAVAVESCTEQLGAPGPWHQRLPHFRPDFTPSVGAELQTEYFIDRADGAAALAAVQSVAHAFADLILACEVRSVAADDLWLSGAYGRDTLALHFTWLLDQPSVLAMLPTLEDALAPFDARPHWGKLTAMAPDVVRSRHPRFDDFLLLVDDVDTTGVFANDYLDRLRS